MTEVDLVQALAELRAWYLDMLADDARQEQALDALERLEELAHDAVME